MKNNIFREKFNISNETRIILYQGGLLPDRGIELLLDSFKNYKTKKFVIVFMGYGPLENKIRLFDNENNTIFFNLLCLLMNY